MDTPLNLLALGTRFGTIPILKLYTDPLIDGGGIRGVSMLLILDEIMRRVQHDKGLPSLPRPCDYFDLIGGTSTGGSVAFLSTTGMAYCWSTAALLPYCWVVYR